MSATDVNPFAGGCAWIDGEFVPIAEANIPIMDWGFLHSDLTYDVVSAWHGNLFRLDDHMARFERGCHKLRLEPSLTFGEMRDILIETVALSGLRDTYSEVVLTRGIAPQGVRDPRQLQARFYAYSVPYVWLVRPEDQEKGVALAIVQQVERISSRSVDPTIKNFHWGDLTRALFEAYDEGALLPALTDGHGLITEGAGYNIFAVVDGRVHTPAVGVLEGVTRKTVIELVTASETEMVVGDLSVGMMHRAEEVFLSSTGGGVIPITILDGRPVGDGRAGPIALWLQQAYWELQDDPRYATPVTYRDSETFTTPRRMVIFGVTEFTAALVRAAKLLRYQVTVCDTSETSTSRERFPGADEVVVDSPQRYLDRVGEHLGPRDAVCVLAHDHTTDVPAIVAALGTGVGYLGVMGSRDHTAERMQRLREEGFDESALARVMAPIGIDIGARTHEETAIAIVAEIIALEANVSARSLRDSTGPIHPTRT